MIRKTTLVYTAAVLAASVSLTFVSACSGSKTVADKINYNETEMLSQVDPYNDNIYSGSVWDSSLIDESRFKLDIKLTKAEEFLG